MTLGSTAWKPIDRMVLEPIWVIKYDIFFSPDGNFCEESHPEAKKFTDCHGWYTNEMDAYRVLNHFPKPNSYRIEKVWKREVIR